MVFPLYSQDAAKKSVSRATREKYWLCASHACLPKLVCSRLQVFLVQPALSGAYSRANGGAHYAQNSIAYHDRPARHRRRPLFSGGGGLGDQRDCNRGMQLSTLLHVLFQRPSRWSP